MIFVIAQLSCFYCCCFHCISFSYHCVCAMLCRVRQNKLISKLRVSAHENIYSDMYRTRTRKPAEDHFGLIWWYTIQNNIRL